LHCQCLGLHPGPSQRPGRPRGVPGAPRHPHYLKGSVFCGRCGSSLIVSVNKNRFGTVYPYFVCLGRHQKRNLCVLRAVRIDQVEDAIVDYYAKVQLTDEQIVQVRAYVIDELLKLKREADRERGGQELRLRRLQAQRKTLLDAHYAGALPLDLLKSEQTRITSEIAVAENRLQAISQHFESVEVNLQMALELVKDCQQAYQRASSTVRRQFNQAFFKQLFITDEYEVTAKLAEPFDVLLGDDLRLMAAQKAELDLGRAVGRQRRRKVYIHEDM